MVEENWEDSTPDFVYKKAIINKPCKHNDKPTKTTPTTPIRRTKEPNMLPTQIKIETGFTEDTPPVMETPHHPTLDNQLKSTLDGSYWNPIPEADANPTSNARRLRHRRKSLNYREINEGVGSINIHPCMGEDMDRLGQQRRS